MGTSCDGDRREAEEDMKRMRMKVGGGWSAVEKFLYEGAGAPFCFPNCHTHKQKKNYIRNNHGSAFPLLGFSGVRRLI